MRALRAAVRWAGWVLVVALAAVGVSIAAVSIFATTDFGRRVVASRLVRVIDDAVAGSLDLQGIEVLPTGAIELRGLRVLDPDGHLVLAVGKASVSVDLTGLRSRVLGLSAELDSPSVLIEQEPDGGISLARAFAPSHPAAPRPEAKRDEGGPGWTVRISRIAVRRAELWWVDAAGATRVEARDVEMDARGTYAADRARAEVRLRGALGEPLEAPVALDLVASRRGDAVRLPVLRAEIGGTALSAIGIGDLGARTGRIAVTRLALDRAGARVLEPRAPQGADLAATAYAESDGEVATAAVRVEPVVAGRPGGRADAAAATRIAEADRALGLDVALDRIDPSRIAVGAPPGEVTLAARGALSGRSIADLRGRLALTISRSRLRRGEVTRAELHARAHGGTIEVKRLSAAAPGVTLDGAGRWKEGGAVQGRLSADGRDVAALARNVAALLGVPAPAVKGRARVEAALGGTSAVPVLDATVDAPSLGSGSLALGNARIGVHAEGTPRALQGRLDLRAATLADGARTLARSLAARAAIAGDEASASATASVPGAGVEPYALSARGRFGQRRESVVLSELSVAYPGTKYALAAPATILLRGPSVDRLELRAGAQRIALAGGIRERGEIDARLEIAALDLARLPKGVAGPADGVAGELSLEARATGSGRRPEVEGRFSIARGAFRTLSPVDAAGTARWDGLTRRATVSVSLARGGGGTLDVRADLPLPLAARPGEPVAARIRAAGVDVEEIAKAAGQPSALSGSLSADVALEGRAGAPVLRAEATLDDARAGDLDALSLWISVDAPGDRLRVTAGGAHRAAAVLAVDAQAPFDLAEALARPDAAWRALRRAPLTGTVALTGVDLAKLAGSAGVPRGVAGQVEAHAAIEGTASAPRGKAFVQVAHGEWSGYRGIAGRIDVDAGDERIAAGGRVSLAGEEALRFSATLGAPPERLGAKDALRNAALRAEAVVPGLSLASAAVGTVPLGGKLEGRLVATGTPGAPEASVELRGAGVTVAGRPLGEARLRASYARAHATVDARLAPTMGGELRASLGLDADLGLGASGIALRGAPAEATLFGDAIDLGALAALAPGTVRSASGKLSVDLRAKGPLARMSPRGKLHVEGGRLAVAELGEWTGIALDASATEDAIEVSHLEVHRGSGRLDANGSLKGLRSRRATLDAHVAIDAFTVTRVGMDLATIDLRLDAGGSWDGRKLEVEARIARGVVRLPNRTPRTLQPLDERKDIVVGSRSEKRRGEAAPAPGTPGVEAEPAFTLLLHVVAPRNLFVKSEDPKVDIELKADVRYELSGPEQYAQGTVDVIRGSVALISGRNFEIERGRIQFTGGPPQAAMLDLQARYDNPAAKVTVNVTGPATMPQIRMSSQPALDESQIAMLIATGRTELQPGAGGVGTISGEEAGKAALAAIATKAFTELVAKKLPLDTVAVEPGALRAGKYVTDKIYVGYTRRLSADPQKGENEDEVRVEYEITSRWTLESRYGNAQSGGANLIWSKNY